MTDSLRLLSLNARSVKGKIVELQALATNYNIICITETHLDSNFHGAQLFFLQNKITYRKYRNAHGGGVLISIDPYLQHTFLDFASDAEVTAIKIHCKHFVPCVLICCYKPSASNSILPLIEYMHNIRKTHPGHSLILTGAFNLPGINWHNTVMSTKWSPMYADFVELLADLDMEQLITN